MVKKQKIVLLNGKYMVIFFDFTLRDLIRIKIEISQKKQELFNKESYLYSLIDSDNIKTFEDLNKIKWD